MRYLKVFTDFLLDIEPLSDDERGRLFTAMLQYAATGREVDLMGNERFLWGTAKKQIDMQADAYSELCERNRKNSTARSQSKPLAPKRIERAEDKDKDKDKEHINKFKPPTKDEVAAYIREQGYSVDAGRFCDFYDSKGWMVGKNRMKNWQAAVRTWQKDTPKKTQYRNEDLERLEVQL